MHWIDWLRYVLIREPPQAVHRTKHLRPTVPREFSSFLVPYKLSNQVIHRFFGQLDPRSENLSNVDLPGIEIRVV